jgi:GntR family transcriptional regulator
VLVERIRLLDERPVILETRYLRADLCASILQENLEQDSIHDWLVQRLHLPLTRVDQRLEAVVLEAGSAALLQALPGDPAFRLSRTTHSGALVVTQVTYLMSGHLYSFVESFQPQNPS